MLAWFNFVVFYSLFLVYTRSLILVSLEFIMAPFSYDSVTASKFGKGVQSCHKRLLILSPKKQKKQAGYAWNFLQPPMQMSVSVSNPYLKINILFFCCPLFFKDFLNLQNQQIDKQTYF